MVQRIEGRPDAGAPGEGHCDAVLAVSCHPSRCVMATGALKRDPTIRLWADASSDAGLASLFRQPPAAMGNGAALAHAANGGAADVTMEAA